MQADAAAAAADRLDKGHGCDDGEVASNILPHDAPAAAAAGWRPG